MNDHDINMVSKLTIKKLFPLTLVAILVLSVTMIFRVSPVSAQQPYIALNPKHISNASSPNTYTVKINVSSTSAFAGYQFYIYWNRTYINATSIVETPPAAWSVYKAGAGLVWNFNATHGRIERAVLDTHSPLVSVTGTFQVMTITFKIIKDSSPSTVVPIDLDYDNTFIADANGDPITPFYAHDGDITVVPEFPVFLIIPLFMALTLAAVLLRKKSLLKTRKSSLVAT
jgi:hypothetical protein